MEILELERVATQVRRDIIRMTSAAGSGHPGGSLSSTEVLVALFFEVMNYDVENITREAKGEDLFYLSNGHIAPVLYSTMARRGIFPVSELGTLRVYGSRLQGHPTPESGLPGIRIATGSLGQGISVAVGHAAAKKIDGDKGVVFVNTGDGELQEGQVWEAVQFAAARKIDNVVVIVDYNNQQIDGSCDEVIPLLDLRAKFESFGCAVLEIEGNDMTKTVEGLNKAKNEIAGNGKPVVVLAKNIMGKGVDFMENTNEYHGKIPNAEQVANALSQLEETLGDY